MNNQKNKEHKDEIWPFLNIMNCDFWLWAPLGDAELLGRLEEKQFGLSQLEIRDFYSS